MNIFKILRNEYFWLGLILLAAFLVRLYRIDAPIADWHSWRQADTAAVSRNFIKEGFNPLIPKYDDMSGVAEKPLVNSQGFRFVEFPVYNIFVYPMYLLFGVNDALSRLVSVFFSLGSVIFVYLISKKYLGILTALLTAFIYALLPFNVFFQRTTLPEPTFLFFALGMLYFMDRWIWDNKINSASWGFIFTTIAFLIKPWAIFFYLPLLYSVFTKRDKQFFFKKFIPLTIFAITPFVLWRMWILQQPQGIPASNWLLNGDGIRFRPAFFWWIVSERMGREILGASGFALFIIGILVRPLKSYFLHVWLLSMVLYFVVFATGNVRHNYYQIIFVPIAAIFISYGFSYLFNRSKDLLPRVWTIPLALLLLSSTFYFTYKIDKEFYKINNPAIVEAGEIADKILPKDAIVLAPYNGDTAFLYQINRRGFPVAILPASEMVSDYGVTHYVSTTYDEKTNWVKRHFQIILETPQFMIADLTNLTSPLDTLDPEP
ncbi:MAG: glycosyltransferase family 39 protein [Candidatus Daviesbacteria bacterium]|nr:glycosyltransferase family 39 protein [Candidatus Daviesbacteria bacterium]